MAEKIADPAEFVERGQLGQHVYDRVEDIIRTSGVTRQQAFDQLALEMGKNPGTLSANYYRIARKLNGKDPATQAVTRARRNRGDISTALLSISQQLNELATEMQTLAEQHSQLDDQLAKLRRIESLLGN